MNFTPGKTTFTDAEHQALRVEVKAAQAEENLSQAEIARQADVSSAVLSEYLREKYAGDNNAPATALHKWVEGRTTWPARPSSRRWASFPRSSWAIC